MVQMEAARSVIGRQLPACPPQHADALSLVLFYQYVEPMWTAAEHRRGLAFCLKLGAEHGVSGRGRCAAEGLNCTLTGSPEGIRAFCCGLRAWNPLFNECDFKITDGLEEKFRFKALTIRKTTELVAYGLEGERAPALATNDARHVEADEYHEMMEKPNTVIIDVRNHYEAAIGHFQPPPGGAEFIDPKMRNSRDFPKWLAQPAIQEKLKGKKVMMYCTGGIRCERASALLSEISKPETKPEEIVMLRGGIERYVKTFDGGGHWAGANYLFDKRIEQLPEQKEAEKTAYEHEDAVSGTCCLCKVSWAKYRGNNYCAGQECQGAKVPVLVCPDCQLRAAQEKETLRCPLCLAGHSLRHLAAPRTKGQKVVLVGGSKRKREGEPEAPTCRLFVGKLPLTVDRSKLAALLGATDGQELAVQWLADRQTGFFYGSAFVEMPSLEQAKAAVLKAGSDVGLRVKGAQKKPRRLAVRFAPVRQGDLWPPTSTAPDRPPVPS